MDIFDVLAVVSVRKTAFMHEGLNEYDALNRAELDVSEEYHISLFDIKRLVGS